MPTVAYHPTPEQVDRALQMDGPTFRRVHGFARSFFRQPAWSEPRWYYVSDLCHCYMGDVSPADMMRALVPPVAMGTLQARQTVHGPQVRLTPCR